MHPRKAAIYAALAAMEESVRAAQGRLTKAGSLTDYAAFARPGESGEKAVTVWTDALRKALEENEIVRIPAAEEPYYVDSPVTIPSNRRIEVEEGAVIRLAEGVRTLLFRNEHTCDGTHRPVSGERDRNIAVVGGRWEESIDHRAGYGYTGMIDPDRSYYGVSTLMFFNNMDGLLLENLTFAHTAGFSVQAGDIRNAVMKNVTFMECYADGLHINGNMENLWIRDVRGQCGDDLVALNAYDWQNSSVDFGPMRTVVCENLVLSADSPCKAMRVQPGLYYFDDGSSVDCALYDVVIRRVRGIKSFKLYYQTPAYRIVGGEPEKGAPGSGDWLFFEDIRMDLDSPNDGFREYLESDPVRGKFAAFEIGSDIGHLFLEDIDLTLYRERFPLSALIAVGPKSVLIRDGAVEVFDPYVSCHVGEVVLDRIRINGMAPVMPEDLDACLLTVEFDDVDRDGRSTGRGTVGSVTLDGERIL